MPEKPRVTKLLVFNTLLTCLWRQERGALSIPLLITFRSRSLSIRQDGSFYTPVFNYLTPSERMSREQNSKGHMEEIGASSVNIRVPLMTLSW